MKVTLVIISDGLSGGESSSVILHLQSLIINIQTGGYFGFYWWSDEVQMLLNMTILTNITDESHPRKFLQEKRILNDTPELKVSRDLS